MAYVSSQIDDNKRESVDYDVVIVGAGPAGLSAACRLAQLAKAADHSISICVLEKGSEVGAHILSGAILETTAIDELFPEWSSMGAPIKTKVCDDRLLFLANQYNSIALPHFATPKPMLNHANHYIISLGDLCRWLAEQAEALGVDIFTGFPADHLLYSEHGNVCGVVTRDQGVDKQGQAKTHFQAGMAIKAKYTLLCEGARGHLGKDVIDRFQLDKESTPQHYALGFKELWQVPNSTMSAGSVQHSLGWPLNTSKATGGGFVYQVSEDLVSVGFIVDLNYSNPWLDPFQEFQQYKHHPQIAKWLQGGERLSYGARALAKGGLSSLPQQVFPGGLLLGCDAGTLNPLKIKGTHCAMKSGILAAESLLNAVSSDKHCKAQDVKGLAKETTLLDYQQRFEASWLYQELKESRNFVPASHQYGMVSAGILAWFEHNVWAKLCSQPLAFRIHDTQDDHQSLLGISETPVIPYPKPDGVVSFDRLSSVYLSGTQHQEDQPCHLQLADPYLPIREHLAIYAEPSQRYCPAGVYEVIHSGNEAKFQINAANCLHCKTCDIKDPSQNIRWTPPENGGPNYRGM